MWTLIDKVHSKIDNTIKYIFSHNKDVVEVSYINKNDGKDIICSPTQTSCNLGCQFCHLTGLNLPAKNIDGGQLFNMIEFVVNDISSKHNTLLISYMGAGEPLMNVNGVVESAKLVKDKFQSQYEVVRFAVASIIPKEKFMNDLMKQVKEHNLEFKFHLSLHSVEEPRRHLLMPKALNVTDSIRLLNTFSRTVGKTEIHYTLMDGVNDSKETAKQLARHLIDSDITVKLLRFSPKVSFDVKRSNKEDEFAAELHQHGISTESYCPPGSDIGASCGQFNVAQYSR